MPVVVTPIYVLVLVALFLLLSVRIIMERRQNRFAYGDNGSPRIQAKIRAQANLAEYAPIGLLLLLIAELQGTGTLWLHLYGAAFTLGRILHGYGMSFRPKELVYRQNGMALTLFSMIGGMGMVLIGMF